MNSPDILINRLRANPQINDAVAVYKEAHQTTQQFQAVKQYAREFVASFLANTGQLKGRTAEGIFGLTRPTPTFAVNEEKWRSACAVNAGLAAVQQRFDEAQRALDEAQRPFLEEITPAPQVYIR